MNETTDTLRHFLTYSGVKLPLKLVSPLAEAEIENRNTFFRGWFDSVERLTALEKVVYGEVELRHRYDYRDTGTLRQAEITDADGEVTVLDFDEQGIAK